MKINEKLIPKLDELNQLSEQTSYVIEKKGDYVYKKYDNGLVEIYQKSQLTVNINAAYPGTSLYYGNLGFTFPETIKELYSINTSVADNNQTSLLGINYKTWPNLNGYSLFIYDFGYKRESKGVTIYTHIVGKWK